MAKSDIDRWIRSRLLHEADPANLASLAHRRIEAPRDDLKEALRGSVTKHHRFMLRLYLQQIDAIEAAIAID